MSESGSFCFPQEFERRRITVRPEALLSDTRSSGPNKARQDPPKFLLLSVNVL